MNNYKVVILGASGSGKTVFLASMFRELSTQGSRGFFLKAEGVNRPRLLTNIYKQVAGKGEWPEGTKRNEVSEWKFTCHVQSKKDGSIFPACTYTFFDYAGGLLTEAEDEEETDSKFHETIQEAHTLLGLLDGKKILDAMKGNESAWDSFILSDLPAIIEKMQNTKAPIHFVLNKWDLFDNEYDLEEVRDFLLEESDQFSNIIDLRHGMMSPVRLIPVSSVGTGFALPQEDGSMKKTGKSPKPYQVEMPLACIVPDIMEKTLGDLKKKKEVEESRTVKIEADLNLWERFTLSVGDYVGLGLAFLLPVDLEFTDNVIQKIGSVISSGANQKIEDANKRSEELRRNRDESIKQVENEADAVDHTINSFLYIRQTIEAMPGARLN
jgi:GTPase SAR1 family protein